MRQIKQLFLFPLMFVVITACSGSSTDSPDEQNDLRLTFSGLEPLQNGFHYEGWALIGSEALTTGKFNINSSGELSDLSGNPIQNGTFTVDYDLTMTSAVVITIEPDGDTDDIPADTHILAGSVSGGNATLNAAHAAALGDDFSSASGSYILATPTDGNDDQDENSGIWFIDLTSGSPEAGLNLPQLPDGWKYEGWVVYNGTPITTGTFLTVDEADEAAPFSGPVDGPQFPGEDYLVNAPDGVTFPFDLAGGMAVISIEPDPDDSPLPFTFKPLAGGIPSDAADRMTYILEANLGSFPTGTASIR